MTKEEMSTLAHTVSNAVNAYADERMAREVQALPAFVRREVEKVVRGGMADIVRQEIEKVVRGEMADIVRQEIEKRLSVVVRVVTDEPSV